MTTAITIVKKYHCLTKSAKTSVLYGQCFPPDLFNQVLNGTVTNDDLNLDDGSGKTISNSLIGRQDRDARTRMDRMNTDINGDPICLALVNNEHDLKRYSQSRNNERIFGHS